MRRLLNKKLKEKKGFTLIEMIIVIAIIAILIALIAPNLQKFLNTSKQTKIDAAAKTLYTASSTYIVEQYTKGAPIKTADWKREGSTITFPSDFIDDYFNEHEVSSSAVFHVVIDAKGNVQYAEWTDDGFTSVYPKGAKEETTTTAAGNP